jgi:CheY-specific phosphatase CheX
MPNASNYNEVARRYGLAATPESVRRLTQLIARQDGDLDEIASLINKDPALRRRMLRLANPQAESEADYTIETVEQAIMRNGIGCALLIAMGTPLSEALIKTFHTMLSLKLENFDAREAAPLEGDHLLGSIAFSGKAAGHVYLRLGLDSAKEVAARVLGLNPAELGDLEPVNDAVGELLNIMTGNFKSNLCDAGLDCRLEPPRVSSTSDFDPLIERGCGFERMAFRAPPVVLFIDVCVNPWHGQ